MKKLKFALAMVVTCLLLAIGCKSQDNTSFQTKDPSSTSLSSATKVVQNIRINITGEPQTLDPRKARSLNDLNVIKMLMEGLTRMNYDNQPELALAEKYSISEDQKTYTFTLKKTKWSNGDPVTSHDFIYSWKKILSPTFPADNANLLYVIKNGSLIKEGKLPLSMLGVQAVDDSTLVVHLEHPVSFFLEALASPTFYPIHTQTDKENPHWAENAETYISCGPFKLSEWKHSDFISVIKNDKYWDINSVKLKKIDMVMVSPETGFNMYQKNELDWEGSPLSNLPLDALDQLKGNKELKTQSYLVTSFIRTNTNKSPFNSVEVRKAFAIAMDRHSIIDHILNGYPAYASGLVPTALGLRDSEYFEDGNVEEAKQLLDTALAESLISNDDLSDITLSFISNEKNYRICQVIQEQWKKAFDINVKLEPLEGKVYFSRVSKQDFQLALGSWVADFRDPINFLEIFKTRELGTNNTNWENNDYLTKLEQSYESTDAETRKGLLKECEEILIKEMPIIPIWHGNMHYIRNEKVKNVIVSETGGIDFKWAFMDKGV
jgi:oligopeptide transport system substrate-binding protein